MSIHGGRSFGRGVVAVCAAGALLVSLLASPASAATAPNNVSIKGILKGGQIVLQQEDPDPDLVFPLGEKDGSTVKEKTEDSVCDSELNPKKVKQPRSHFTADVDGTGKISNFAFHFAQGTTGEKFTIMDQEFEVCAQLEVTNPTQIQGQLTDKQVTLNPGPVVRANFIIKTKPEGQVQWVCRTETNPGNHDGKFSEAKTAEGEKQQHDWNLDHAPKDQKFQVPAVSTTAQCPSLVANMVNDGLGLPTLGEAAFKWAVYDCDAKDCSTLDGHPNK